MISSSFRYHSFHFSLRCVYVICMCLCLCLCKSYIVYFDPWHFVLISNKIEDRVYWVCIYFYFDFEFVITSDPFFSSHPILTWLFWSFIHKIESIFHTNEKKKRWRKKAAESSWMENDTKTKSKTWIWLLSDKLTCKLFVCTVK